MSNNNSEADYIFKNDIYCIRTGVFQSPTAD